MLTWAWVRLPSPQPAPACIHTYSPPPAQDLRALMRHTVAPLLRPGGRLVLREFHPVSTKLITSRGKKHKVSRG